MPWPWDLHIFSECNHLGNCTLYAVLSFGSLGKNNNVEKKNITMKQQGRLERHIANIMRRDIGIKQCSPSCKLNVLCFFFICSALYS